MTARLDRMSATRASRRKACDLCFTKKIKCDMLQPSCSNCILYRAECKTGSGRKKAPVRNRPKQPTPQPSQQRASPDGASTKLDSVRLERIEQQLEQLIKMNGFNNTYCLRSNNLNMISGTGSYSESSQDDLDYAFEPPLNSNSDSDCTAAGYGNQMHLVSSPHPSSQAMCSLPTDAMWLPPLEDILPVVEHYFDQTGSMIPLFDRCKFMGMLNQWFLDQTTRSMVAWAAIQIVLALAQPTVSPQLITYNIKRAGMHFRSSYAVIADIARSSNDLLGVQVLLGVGLVYQCTPERNLSEVVVSTAVRTGHRIQLHCQSQTEYYTAAENLERQRVFWTAYMLDKNVSVRSFLPPVQADQDIDLDLPDANTPDGIGMICTDAGQTQINYFRSVIGLAQIQGRIYDWLLSNASTKASREKRSERARYLRRALGQWYEAIPVAFHIDHVGDSVGGCALLEITKMYYTYLACLLLTTGVYGHNPIWMKTLANCHVSDLKDMARSLDLFEYEPNREQNSIRGYSSAWTFAVGVTRGCMRLFNQNRRQTDCLVWKSRCAYLSGMLLLSANTIIDGTNPDAASDCVLCQKALEIFDKTETELPPHRQHPEERRMMGSLLDMALDAVAQAKSPGQMESNNLLHSALLTCGGLPDHQLDWASMGEMGGQPSNFAELYPHEGIDVLM